MNVIACFGIETGVSKAMMKYTIGELKKQIAGFKVPKQLFVVNELPRNVMGKVQKNLLRQSYQAVFEGT